MFARTRYLEWAARYYGKVPFDLASSGIPTAPFHLLAPADVAVLGDPSGWGALRQAIARYNDVPPEEASGALGTTHAIWLAYSALASPGDEILVEDPGYEPLVRIAEGVGARVARFRREPDEGYALDVRRVASALSEHTKAVVVTDLHNPSGCRATTDSIAEVASLLQSRGGHLVVDEVYAPFDELVDEAGIFRRSARKLASNVVVVSSLTKCYGVGPLRAGWLLGPPDVVRRADDATMASCGALPLAHAHLGAIAFARVGELAARARAIVGDKRRQVAAWARAHGLGWSAPSSGLFGFVTVPDGGDLTPLIERAAVEHEVLVAPGSFFGMPAGFRVASSLPADRIDEGLARLAAALSLPERSDPG